MEKQAIYSGLLVMLLITLSGCGGSKNDPNPIEDVDISQVPDMRIGECDSLPSLPTAISTNEQTPSPLALNTFVSGTLSPDVPVNSVHYWSIELPLGDYRLILDTARADNSIGDLGVRMQSKVTSNTNPTTRTLADIKDIDRRIREIGVLSITGGAGQHTLLLSIQPNFGIEEYQLSILSLLEDVPSPYLTKCPEITQLALSSPQAFVLEAKDIANSERWFSLQTPAGNHTLAISLNAEDAAIAGVDAEMELVGRYGQIGGVDIKLSETSAMLDTSIPVTMESIQEGYWAGYFRFRNLGRKLNGEFAISLDPSTSVDQARSYEQNNGRLRLRNMDGFSFGKL